MAEINKVQVCNLPVKNIDFLVPLQGVYLVCNGYNMHIYPYIYLCPITRELRSDFILETDGVKFYRDEWDCTMVECVAAAKQALIDYIPYKFPGTEERKAQIKRRLSEQVNY